MLTSIFNCLVISSSFFSLVVSLYFTIICLWQYECVIVNCVWILMFQLQPSHHHPPHPAPSHILHSFSFTPLGIHNFICLIMFNVSMCCICGSLIVSCSFPSLRPTLGKEPWLANSLVEYYYTTRSLRAQEILAQIREPLDKVVPLFVCCALGAVRLSVVHPF